VPEALIPAAKVGEDRIRAQIVRLLYKRREKKTAGEREIKTG